MKRYKLTRSPNPETHASGEVIFIKDENGNELNVGFSDQCDAFDYIKLQVENDKEYADCLNNPSKHIMDMYNSLDEFDKKMIEQSLIQKYRNECMYQYFSQVESKSIDADEKKYYLVTPEGLIFHEIPFEEIHNLTREVWISSCPCCGGTQGYYYSKNEAKQNSKFCVQCSCTHLFPVKRYKGYYKQNVNFRLLTKGYKEYRGIKYPYMDIHG